MRNLLDVKLISLLIDNSQKVSNLEMHEAYEKFVVKVEILNQSENDYSVIFRTLSLTRIELKARQVQTLYEQGGKCP